MVLEIKKLLTKAEYCGNFSFRFQPSESEILIPLCKVDGEVVVDGEYEIFEGDEVEVSFKLSYRLKGSCSYCLEDAMQDIEYACNALFVVGSPKNEEYSYDGNRLDLTQAVTDAFMISQPTVLLCKSDCKGIKLS